MSNQPWWRSAVVYQCYLRSFADGNGDGIGDLAGLRARIPYLASLGIDALWINPWYPSPQHDAGYDVADFRAIEPAYGDLADADALIEELHGAGIRLLLDIVPNHLSWEHTWFKQALAGDEAARARFIFRPGRGEHGDLPPNNWQSAFGGSAWTRTSEPDGEWYLHMFAPQQPDLCWENPEVIAEFESVLRFWFDRGVDGFRIDVAHGLVKAPGLPDAPPGALDSTLEPHPAWDQEGVHDIFRGWRRVADEYDPPRIFVAEAWVPDNERLARFVRPDELHTAFQFDLLTAPFRAPVMRTVIDDARQVLGQADNPSTWVLSNHDVVRHVTRYARSQPEQSLGGVLDRERWLTDEADLELGLRRARAAALVTMALPGKVYIYQGDELGLPEVEDIADHRRLDPIFERSGGADPGRDGCRVPLPWHGDQPTYGFSPDGVHDTWLPQPQGWAPLTVSAQDGVEGSTLELYRRALRLRRERFVGAPDLVWIDAPDDVLAFRRGSLECWLNTGAEPVELPPGTVLLRSDPTTDDGLLPGNTAAWIDVGEPA
ncbi:glycoside hydrolase family 13 protein [Nocardioides limicola]|uniref:glycoside hydrolase family 13 protein n=1 Tax=Nocardioides limicola TaxID=2803368 RepID=UPI00193B9506|nr:glycoside hydrolase family 13 protein [Nocardioides sp. DJM-14]